jgi:hypothetical protein
VAAERRGPRHRAALGGRRRRPAQHLLDRGRQQARVGPERGQLVGLLEEGEHAARDRVASRLGTGGEEQREEGVQLEVGELRRVDVRERRVHDDRQHVVGRRRALRRDERGGVVEHAHPAAAARLGEADVALAHVEARVEERAELVAVLLRHAEQDADGLHRQLAGHVEHEVERDAVLHRVEQRCRPPAQLHLEPLDGARREARGHQSTDAGVARVVHHRQDHPRHLHVLEEGAAVLAVAAPLGRVGARIDLDGNGLGIGGDGPEPLAAGRVRGRLVPVHGRLAAVPLEHVVREPVREAVEVGEVDVGHRAGCHPCDC